MRNQMSERPKLKDEGSNMHRMLCICCYLFVIVAIILGYLYYKNWNEQDPSLVPDVESEIIIQEEQMEN